MSKPEWSELGTESGMGQVNANELLEKVKRLESENAALKKMIGEWAEEVEKECPCKENAGMHSCQRPGFCFCVKEVRPGSENKHWPPCLMFGHAVARKMREVAK